MKKVLFVSYAYPPISSPGAMRVAHLAKDLASFEYDITVLTCQNGYSSMKSSCLEERFQNGIEIILTKDLVNKNKADVILKNKGDENFISLIKLFLIRILKNLIFPDRDITWMFNALSSKELKKRNFDIVIGSYPTTTNLIISKILSLRFRADLILDMRDLWIEDFSFKSKSLIRKFSEKVLNRWIFSHPKLILSVSEFNKAILSKRHNCKVALIRNGYDQDLYKLISNPDLKSSNIFRISYSGSFYNGERSPNAFLEALSLLKREKHINSSSFLFEIYGNPEDFFQDLVNKYDVKDLIQFKGFLEQKELLKDLLKSNILLAITRTQKISKGELTTKIYEYLGLGLPILCLTKPDFEIASMLHSIENASTVDVENSRDIYLFLKQAISKKSDLRVSINYNYNFSRYEASKRLYKCIESL